MLEVLNCRIHVTERGVGPAVLLLHGNPDSSGMWGEVVASLSRSYRCITPDLPGYGKSVAPDDFDYTLEGQARFVDGLYSALGISGPIKLIGHDFGGIFAAAWMARFPDKVAQAIFINSAFSTQFHWHIWARIWRRPGLGELSMMLTNRLMFGRELRRGSRGLSAEHIDRTYRAMTASVKRTVLRLYRSVRRESFAGWEEQYQAAARRIPVLVLWGEGDPYIPPALAETFGAKKIVRISGAGHWLPVVEPLRVAAESASFFETETGASPADRVPIGP